MDRRDACSAEGAERLRRQIEGYWRERGASVEVSVVEVPGVYGVSRSQRSDVRSDMIDGWPRRA